MLTSFNKLLIVASFSSSKAKQPEIIFKPMSESQIRYAFPNRKIWSLKIKN